MLIFLRLFSFVRYFFLLFWLFVTSHREKSVPAVLRFHGSIPETRDEVPSYFASAVADQPSREASTLCSRATAEDGTARREAMADKSASRRGPANKKVRTGY